MKVEWETKYSVNIKIIDEQHQNFFTIVNKIYALLGESPIKSEVLLTIVNELSNYALYHFSTEEEYFEEFKYDEAEAHIGIHDLFRERMKGFMDKVRNPEVDLAPVVKEIADFVIAWLIGHILTEDRKYIQCFTEHGLK